MDKEKALEITTDLVLSIIENAVSIDLGEAYTTEICKTFDAIYNHIKSLD